MIYFIIALLACSTGSLLGIGGGVIIVPTLISIGVTKELASVNSSITVLVMAAISSYTYMKRKQGAPKLSILIAVGSIPGSYFGVYLNCIISAQLFNLLFSILILTLLILMLIKDKLPRINVGTSLKILFGMFIGILSGLFGIGGGPITVPVLLIFFGLTQKIASATSTYITFITSFTSVISNIASGNNDLSLALFMIPGAILGSRIGTTLNKKITERSLTIVFNSLLVCLLVMNLI